MPFLSHMRRLQRSSLAIRPAAETQRKKCPRRRSITWPRPCGDVRLSFWTERRRSGSPILARHARRGVAGDVTCWQLDLRIGCGENETERSPELQPVDKVGLEPADP